MESAGPLKLIYPYFKKNMHKILLGLLCMVVVDLAQLIVPQIIRQAIDTLTFDNIDKQQLLIQCSFIVALGLGMALLRFGWRNLLMGSARDVEKGIRDSLFAHILSLDTAYFDRVKTGDIMAHATSDINHVRMAFGFGLIVLVDTVLLGGATLGIMFWTHPKLTAIAMIPMPFLVVVTRVLGKKMYSYHRTAQESFSALTELVRESFFGIRVIKVFNFERLSQDKTRAASKDYFKKNLKRAVVTALLRPLLGMFFNLSTLIIIFYGGYLAIQSMLTPGELVAFLQYLGILAWPVIAIGWMTNLFQRGMASLKRINTLLDSRPDVQQPASPVRLEKTNTPIRFENVGFEYPGSDSPALSDIDLTIEPGQRIGISGPPGAGKTTLVQLIPRLYNPSSGRVFIDNIPVDRLDIEELRGRIAYMPQESFLFSGTIRENLTLGLETAESKIKDILNICCLDRTVNEMPDGLDTVVGERGITLSGGQKQRIALARTLIHPRPIIILDDPISQIDTHTAEKIIRNINEMNLDASIIIISHRISALAACDRICIFKNGKLANLGTHDHLIEADRFYRQSYLVQQFEERHAD